MCCLQDDAAREPAVLHGGCLPARRQHQGQGRLTAGRALSASRLRQSCSQGMFGLRSLPHWA